MSVKIGKYTYKKSTRKNKKLMTTVNGKIIHFGDPNMQHYHDKTGIWSNLDHNDNLRRLYYLTRSQGIKDSKGNLTKNNPMSPNWHSRNILW